MTTPTSTCIALSLVIALTTITPAANASPGGQHAGEAGTPGPMPRRAAASPLRIEVDSTVDDAELLREWITAQNSDVATKVPVISGHEQWIAVHVGGVTYDYTITVVAMRDGEPVGNSAAPLGCECTTERLLGIIETRIDMAVSDLKQPPPRPQLRRSERPEIEIQPIEPIVDDSGGRERSLQPLGIAGVGLAVLGAGALGGGVFLWLRPDDIRTDPPVVETRSTRKAGAYTMASGGATVLIGLTMIVAERLRRRKDRVAVAPSVGPRGAGVAITGRF